MRRKISQLVCFPLAVFALLGLHGYAAAGSMMVVTDFGPGEEVTLAELEDCGRIVVGDKEFVDFVYTAQPGTPTADQIIVEGFENPNGEIGLVFNVAFAAGIIGPSILDASLLFTVNILDPNFVFDTASLTGTAVVPTLDGNSGVASIEEVIVGEPGGVDFGLNVENNVLDGVQGPVSLFDTVTFPPDSAFTSLDITKDIFVGAGDFTGTNPPDDFDRARLTTFTQVFTQRIIPEPGSACLSLLALFGCSAAMLRQRWG